MSDTTASSPISAHIYTPPVDEPFGRCVMCGYGEAAHTNTAAPYVPGATRYRCPDCVWASEYLKPAPHKGECPRDRATSS